MENKSTRWFVDKWGKSCKAKTPLCDFKVTIPKNLLINNQVITSIRNLINYRWPISKYQPTVEPLPKYPIGLDLVVAFFPLDAQTSNLWLTFYTDPNMWLTLATWTDVVGYKVLHFINNEDLKALGYKTLWHRNAVASHIENKSLGLCIRVWQLLK